MAITAFTRGRRMVTRFSSGAQERSSMAEGTGNPGTGSCSMIRRRTPRGRGFMANITGQGRRRYVIARLGSWCHTRKSLSGMAVLTGVANARVVHRRTTKIGEAGHRMAALAGRQCGRHVIARLGHGCDTSENLAVMAASATADNAGMNHHRTGEVAELARRVTGLARQRGRQVVARFGYRRHSREHLTIMASDAIAQDTGVVHHRPGEIGELARRVAGLA
jgi:hypothetical protein